MRQGETKYQISIIDDMRVINKLGDTQLTDLKKLDRVIVRLSHRNSEGCYGTVHYYGSVPEYPTQYSTTFPYIYGVELDEPKGNTNGVINGKQYFRCAEQYGVFVAPPDVKKLHPSQDPLANMSPGPMAGVKITRTNPNHFQKEDLSALLAHIQERSKQSSDNASAFSSMTLGHIKRFRIATVTSANVDEVTKEFLDLLPQRILNAHSSFAGGGVGGGGNGGGGIRNGTLTFTPDGYAKGAPNIHGIMFNVFPAIGQLYAMDKVDIDPAEMDTRGIDLWYIELNSKWRQWSRKILDPDHVDWSIGKNSDQFNSKWVLTNHWRTQEWVSILQNQNPNTINVPYPVVHECCVPRFIQQQEQQQQQQQQQRQQYLGNSLKCNPHYIPLGFFREDDLSHDLDMAIELRPRFLQEGKAVEFALGNLVHESVQNVEELLPYLKYEVLDIDETAEHMRGWFPMDWVYSEVKFVDKDWSSIIESYFNKYNVQHNSDGVTTFNPYYWMRFPRIPLCYLSTLLPLAPLRHYAERIEKVKVRTASESSVPYQSQWQPETSDNIDNNSYHARDSTDEKGLFYGGGHEEDDAAERLQTDRDSSPQGNSYHNLRKEKPPKKIRELSEDEDSLI
ncbi:hypothetical protein RFI_32608 [Reticulomyxa filosa]|uniref:CAP-Gly domain-containing protein n=1 Tax=Reticulomyxa filosa TaxID=46433 RepID=X6LUH4_RETFI|nr:hypothetical protein RFI_32608 [Reticulomyxa filosa]|eukprot:ETO04787.1 hypothetical protein RFI_32608 [Reticulomyxa filosa]